MNPALLLALASSLLFTTYYLYARVLSIKSGSPLSLSLIFSFFAALWSVPVLLFEPGKFSDLNWFVLGITFLATCFYGVADAAQFYARKYLEASRQILIQQFAVVVAVACSFIFLNEEMSFRKMLAVGLIVGGNIIALYKNKVVIMLKGLLFACVLALASGSAVVADKAVFSHYPVGFYMLLMFGAPGLYILCLFATTKEPLNCFTNEIKRTTWKLPFLTFFMVAGYYTFLKSLQIADLSFVSPIIYTSTIFTVLGGTIILHERENVAQKIIGAILVFLGILFIN